MLKPHPAYKCSFTVKYPNPFREAGREVGGKDQDGTEVSKTGEGHAGEAGVESGAGRGDQPASINGNVANVTQDVEEVETKRGYFKSCVAWSPRERMMITSMAIAQATGFAALSVIGPLFPPLSNFRIYFLYKYVEFPQANQRGMQPTILGLVFSASPLAAVIFAPGFGRLTPIIGVKVPMVIGLLVSGLCCVVFGTASSNLAEMNFMDAFHALPSFTAGVFLSRIVMGIAYAAYMTSLFAAISALFQTQMGLVLSMVEVPIGLGVALGPVLGSVLYSIGGYRLPFAVLGGTQIAATLPLLWALPSTKAYLEAAESNKTSTSATEEPRVEKPQWHLFVSWEPMLVLTNIFVVAVAFGYFFPILQPFLDKEGGMFAIILVGLVTSGMGGLVMGPARFLQGILPSSVITTVVGLTMVGLGFSFAVIPTFHGFLAVTIASGFPANVETYGMTSAFWNVAWSFGEAVGPTIGSAVADTLQDFVVSFEVIAYVLLAFSTIIGVHIIASKASGAEEVKEGTPGDGHAKESNDVQDVNDGRVTRARATASGSQRRSQHHRQPGERRQSIWQSIATWSPRERLMVTAMAFAEGTGFASLTIISPLYPRLAYSRGMSRAIIGLVFSSFAIAAFIASPLFAFVTPKFGVRAPMVVGLIISGLSSVSFGLLDLVHNYLWFTVASIILRIMLGLTYAAYITSVFATVTTIFQHQMGLILSVVEIMVGVGISIGPIIGSALFSLGGFRLPFIAMGVVQMVMTVPLMWLVPGRTEYLAIAAKAAALQDDEPENRTERKPLWLMLLSWEPMLVLITVGTIGVSFVYFHPILQPFLELKFGIKEDTAGPVFLAMLGSYCICAPVSGVMSDTWPHRMYYQILAGLFLAALGTLIIGPSPLFDWILPQSLVTTVVGLILIGVGHAIALIPTFHGFLSALIYAGYPSDVKTFGVSSAFWNSAWALGEAIGPTISSAMVDAVEDYVVSFFVISAVLFALMLLIGSHLLWMGVIATRKEKRGKLGVKNRQEPSSQTSSGSVELKTGPETQHALTGATDDIEELRNKTDEESQASMK